MRIKLQALTEHIHGFLLILGITGISLLSYFSFSLFILLFSQFSFC